MLSTYAKNFLKEKSNLIVDRNKWFFISLLSMLITIFSLWQLYVSNNRSLNNLQIAWVKMQPHGTWDIDFNKTAECAKDYFPATINFMIRQFVEQRYSLSTTTIQSDFGAAQLLMSPKMANEFLSIEQFNAVKIVTEYQGCQSCQELITTVRNISHYDADVTQFGAYRGTLYRTNVFITQNKIDPYGNSLEKTNKIISLQWRLKNLEEIKLNIEILKYNPIGMEILKADILDEPENQ